MITYYTVMDRSSTRVCWVVSALTLVGIGPGGRCPAHTGSYDFFVGVLEFGAGGMAPIISRTRRADLVEVEARAETRGGRARPGLSNWPRRRSAPGSPGNCTTWSPTTSR